MPDKSADIAAADVPGDDPNDGKNRAAVALGRLGGLKGGPARAARLTAEQRSEIARKAARVRWSTAEAQEAASPATWPD